MIKRLCIIVGILLLGVFTYSYVMDRDASDVLNHDDALEFKLLFKGKEYHLSSKEKERYLELVNEWSDSLDSVGNIDINSYAPGILLVSKYVEINFHKNRTIISVREKPNDTWSQRSRKPTKEDVKLRTYLDGIIQERLAYETRFDDFKE